MPSIFAFPIFRESTMIFTIPGGETVDSRGAAVSGTPTIVTIKAYLVRRRVMPKTSGSETAIIGTADLEGRLIDPLALPPGLLEGSVGSGTINGEDGIIELLPTARDGLNGIEGVMGQKIRVRFSRRTQYVGIS